MLKFTRWSNLPSEILFFLPKLFQTNTKSAFVSLLFGWSLYRSARNHIACKSISLLLHLFKNIQFPIPLSLPILLSLGGGQAGHCTPKQEGQILSKQPIARRRRGWPPYLWQLPTHPSGAPTQSSRPPFKYSYKCLITTESYSARAC